MIPPVVAQGLAIASLVWGQPQCGQVRAEVYRYPAGDLSSGMAVIGGYTSMRPGYRWGPCVITLPPSDFELDKRTICTVVVHEWGHLAGQLHSTSPRSPMNPDIPPYWRCDARNRAKQARLGGLATRISWLNTRLGRLTARTWCSLICRWPGRPVTPTAQFTALDELVQEGKLGPDSG